MKHAGDVSGVALEREYARRRVCQSFLNLHTGCPAGGFAAMGGRRGFLKCALAAGAFPHLAFAAPEDRPDLRIGILADLHLRADAAVEKLRQTARNLKTLNLTTEQIAAATGLSASEIETI